MDGLKVGVIGGGSSYTPELIEGFLKRKDELRLAQLVLMDINPERLDIIGKLAQRMIDKAHLPIELVLTTNRKEALNGANFVVTQIRQGGLEGRARDESIPLEFDIIGQETTGPGGFAMALRTIPVMLEIAHEYETLSPDGWMINFTNPSGMIAEAISHYSRVRAIGLCNAPITMQSRIATLLAIDREHITMDYFGLNHLTWIKKVYLDGIDVTGEVTERVLGEQFDLTGYKFNARMVKALGLIPSGYLQYFYHRDKVLAKLKESMASGKPRAEVVMEIDRELMEMYKDPNLKEKPDILNQRGGAWYSDAGVGLISAIVNNKNEIHYLNVSNQGALKGLPDDVVVEIPCLVNKSGPHPLTIGEIPLSVRGLIQQMKAYEQLTVEGAVRGDYDACLLALANHPLVPNVDAAVRLLDRILEANRDWLPQFIKH